MFFPKERAFLSKLEEGCKAGILKKYGSGMGVSFLCY